jgi:formylglycine-generating enzyme required for sulfatase activity
MRNLLPTFVYIPAGSFLMGTPENELSGLAQRYGGTRESYREESPQHSISLPAFALAQTPVTSALYGAYVAATGAAAPLNWRGAQPPDHLADHPVVDVTWHDAQAFCAWLTEQVQDALPITGAPDTLPAITAPHFRLPTEAEWEYAARGSDGRTFPWGNTFDPACANTREAEQNSTTPTGTFPQGASPYGVLDLAGNVWEWTATLDALYPYDAGDGREEWQTEGRRMARGGCYANPQGFARCACRFRFAPGMSNMFLGFRLAIEV